MASLHSLFKYTFKLNRLLFVVVVVLFVFAWRAKVSKKCTGIDIVLTGNAGGFIFMDEKEILKLINEQGIKVGTPIANINLYKIVKKSPD